MKTNKRTRIHVFHTRVKLRSLLKLLCWLSCLSLLLVVCLTFGILFTKSLEIWGLGKNKHKLCLFGWLSSHRICGPTCSGNTQHLVCRMSIYKAFLIKRKKNYVTVTSKEWAQIASYSLAYWHNSAALLETNTFISFTGENNTHSSVIYEPSHPFKVHHSWVFFVCRPSLTLLQSRVHTKVLVLLKRLY